MRFRVIKNAKLEGIAGSRNGETWKVLFQNDPEFPGFPDDLVRQEAGAFERALEKIDRRGVSIPNGSECLPPFRRAGKFLCVGLNYLAHAKESGMAVPEYPTVFARFNTGLVGYGQPLIKPRLSDKFDYESELAVIVGRRGRHIPEETALDYVAGYSIFNDGSIRDYQLRTPQWTIGKNFDGTGAFGPDFVTRDELPDGCVGLTMRGRLNGETVQETAISDLIFGVAKLLALISAAMTLEPGDVISTGTPSGVGLSFDPPKMLKAGDVFEIEIDKIGTLRNPVVNEV